MFYQKIKDLGALGANHVWSSSIWWVSALARAISDVTKTTVIRSQHFFLYSPKLLQFWSIFRWNDSDTLRKDWDFFGLAAFVLSDQRNALKVAGQTLRWRGCSPSSDVSTFNPPPTSHPPPKYHPVDRRPFRSNTSLALTRVSTILKSSNIFHMWSLVETHAAHILSVEFHKIPASYLWGCVPPLCHLASQPNYRPSISGLCH